MTKPKKPPRKRPQYEDNPAKGKPVQHSTGPTGRVVVRPPVAKETEDAS